MNMPQERSPSSDPAGGVVEPQVLPIHAVTFVETVYGGSWPKPEIHRRFSFIRIVWRTSSSVS